MSQASIIQNKIGQTKAGKDVSTPVPAHYSDIPVVHMFISDERPRVAGVQPRMWCFSMEREHFDMDDRAAFESELKQLIQKHMPHEGELHIDLEAYGEQIKLKTTASGGEREG